MNNNKIIMYVVLFKVTLGLHTQLRCIILCSEAHGAAGVTELQPDFTYRHNKRPSTR